MTLPQDDDELMRQLRDAVRSAGDVTDPVLRIGESAFAWRTIDEDLELAELVFDSARDPQLTTRDDTTSGRRREFQAPDCTLEITVTAELLLGRVSPAEVSSVGVLSADRSIVEITTDAGGRFELPRPAVGPVKIRCRHSTGGLMTEWLRL